MQIERSLSGVKTLGPGNRLAIWVNGCKRRCLDCVSPELQVFCPANEVSIEDYFSWVDFNSVDGVTISGGEPFEQLTELNNLVTFLTKKKGIKDILVYTGYTIEELRGRMDYRIDSILNHIAVLIDGPYIKSLDTGKGNLKGSDNQRILFLRTELKPCYDNYMKEERKIQVFDFGNHVVAAGIPNQDIICEFMDERC